MTERSYGKGVEKYRQSKRGHRGTTAKIDAARPLANMLYELGRTGNEKTRALKKMRRFLIDRLRDEGCTGPTFRPPLSAPDSQVFSFAEMLFFALTDVRTILKGDDNTVVATIRLAEFCYFLSAAPMMRDASNQFVALEKQLAPKHKGAAIVAAQAKARRERHIRLAKELHDKNPKLSRTDVAWQIHHQLSGSMDHKASQRIIFNHIKPVFPQ